MNERKNVKLQKKTLTYLSTLKTQAREVTSRSNEWSRLKLKHKFVKFQEKHKQKHAKAQVR